MRNLLSYSVLVLCILLLSSCASILSDSSYPLTVTTDPVGAKVSIKDKNDKVIFEDNSPATIMLDASDGFFKKAKYTVTVSHDGFGTKTVPVNFKVDGWYWGNILFGGIVGMLIVDPATGAMYKLDDEYINVRLKETGTANANPELRILDLNDIPADWTKQLVLINP